MKKALYILFLFLLNPAFAQETNSQTDFVLSIDLKAGYLNSTLKGKDLNKLAVNGDVNGFSGFFIGGGIKNWLGKNLSFRHELFFRHYGAKFHREMQGFAPEMTLKMDAFRLYPISLAYEYRGFSVYAGPYVNMMLSALLEWRDENGVKHKDRSIYGSSSDEQEERSYIQKADLGMVAGLEYKFDFNLLIGARYSHGFSYLFDNSHAFHLDEPTRKNLKIYNQDLGFYLGYAF